VNKRSPIPWLTPEQYEEWQAAYSGELLADPSDEGQVLRRAAERTAHLWGVRIAPDGVTEINPDRWPQPASENQPGSGLVPDHEPEAETG
jgi:hypothetical protein